MRLRRTTTSEFPTRPLLTGLGLLLGAVGLTACGTLIGDPAAFEATGKGDTETSEGDVPLVTDARISEDQFLVRDVRVMPPDGSRPLDLGAGTDAEPPADVGRLDATSPRDGSAVPPADAGGDGPALPPVPDARVPPPADARLELPDARAEPIDARVESIDARVEPIDARVEPIDARLEPPDARPEPPDAAPPDACIAGVEICDGVDNDCDLDIDESDPRDCERCGVPFNEGVCAYGVFVCVAGEMNCVSSPPAPAGGVTCNGQDDDCDGTIDEAGDGVRPELPELAALVAHCGPPLDAAPTLGVCPDASVGCIVPSVCVEPACRDACGETRALATTACIQTCAGQDPLQGECALDCLRAADDGHLACLADCAAVADLGGASRWTCAEGPVGPTCTATVCPEGFKPRGDRCVPRVELCNNGIDDDGDGLIDGVLVGPDPCTATFDQRGTPQQMGRCQSTVPGTPCEDAARLASYNDPVDEWGSLDPATPRMVDLTYRYALDTEEVSIRAYAECVAAGCCLEPISPAYLKARDVLASGRSAERAEDPDRCAATPDPFAAVGAETMPDLPVTGLSWCMARDYCNWAGKRLPTEYEWEHAATGPATPEAQRRIFPWGDEPPPDCVESQCCRAEGYDGPLPGACANGFVDRTSELRVCPEETPVEGVRQACSGTYDKSAITCQGLVEGPAPAYANRDGATPEGLLNMAGNVSEWTFDWNTDGLWDLNPVDPVGAGCDATDFRPKRAIRGRDFTSLPKHLRAMDRFSMWESSRAPNIGFRCGRTLRDDDTLCDPQMPLANRDRCLPGADVRPPTPTPGRADLPACSGPDFNGQDPVDLARCGGAPRAQSAFCDDGISDFCPSDTPTGDADGCGSFIVTRFALPTGVVGESDGVALLNAIFESSLATNGGSTLLVLGAPQDFTLSATNWPFGFGSADIDAQGRLVWLGTEGLVGCDTLPHGAYTVRTLNGRRDLSPVCRAVTSSDIWLREAPVSLAFSALAMEAAYEPADDTLSGTMTLIMTFADTARLRLGADENSAAALGALLARVGAGARSLCGVPIAFSCFAQPLFMPGCNPDFSCGDPETCMGWGLPFEFDAVRAPRAGLPNLRACAQ